MGHKYETVPCVLCVSEGQRDSCRLGLIALMGFIK
jgi:hypothetical protein